MKKYTPTILILLIALIFQLLPASASFTPNGGLTTVITNNATTTINNNATSTFSFLPTCIATSTLGQLLYVVGTTTIGCVPNTFASSTTIGFNVNLGTYAAYANPSGMFNTYQESLSGSPVLSASFMASTTNYMQVFLQNLAKGGNASADLVIANDRGTATSSENYLDLGIANTGQVDTSHPIINPYDGYLYTQTGRLILGSASLTASSSVIISAGMATSTYFRFDQYSHLISRGPAPTSLTGCGTTPSVSGNDSNGVITLGTGLSVTACTLAFKNAFPAASNVTCSISTNSALVQPAITAVSTTGFSVGLSLSLAAGKIYYQCMANE